MILVTGSSGFIGGNLVSDHVGKESIVAVDIVKSNLPPKVTQVTADLTQKDSIEALYSHEFDKIVHAAAIISPQKCQEEPHMALSVNVTGTMNMLELARRKDVKKFVYISTGGIYKNSNPCDFVTENWEKEPKGFYAISKVASESMVSEYASTYGFQAAAIRITAPYGEGMVKPGTRLEIPDALHRHTVLFASRFIRKMDLVMPYGGDHTVNYTYVGDIVHGINAALKTDFEGFEPFNITSGHTYSIRELAEAFKKIDPSINVDIGPGDLTRSTNYTDPLLAPLKIKQGRIDISKAKRMLGFTPKYTLKDALTRLVVYMKKHDIQ